MAPAAIGLDAGAATDVVEATGNFIEAAGITIGAVIEPTGNFIEAAGANIEAAGADIAVVEVTGTFIEAGTIMEAAGVATATVAVDPLVETPAGRGTAAETALPAVGKVKAAAVVLLVKVCTGIAPAGIVFAITEAPGAVTVRVREAVGDIGATMDWVAVNGRADETAELAAMAVAATGGEAG